MQPDKGLVHSILKARQGYVCIDLGESSDGCFLTLEAPAAIARSICAASLVHFFIKACTT